MGVQAVLVLLLMFASTVKTQEGRKGGVQFWRSTVTLTCPGDGTWYDSHEGDKSIHESMDYQYQTEYKQQLKYRCKYHDLDKQSDKITYFFYVRGKTCENCFELDATFFGLAIIVDVIGTAVVMVMIFRCTKKRSSDGSTHSSKPPVPSGSRPPTAPPRDYEQLNPRTRATETYSTVVNRMG